MLKFQKCSYSRFFTKFLCVKIYDFLDICNSGFCSPGTNERDNFQSGDNVRPRERNSDLVLDPDGMCTASEDSRDSSLSESLFACIDFDSFTVLTTGIGFDVSPFAPNESRGGEWEI